MAESGRALTAESVQAAAAAGRSEIALPPGAVVTPLARDTARELGVRLDSGGPHVADSLEHRVRGIVQTLLASSCQDMSGARTTAPSVTHVDGRSVQLSLFPYDGPPPGQEVRVADVVGTDQGSPIAAGFMTLTKGSFPWTLTYDEIEYVIEGELHIGLPRGPVVAKPGDVVYVPKGTAITFGTPSWAKFLYVTYPADWEAGIT